VQLLRLIANLWQRHRSFRGVAFCRFRYLEPTRTIIRKMAAINRSEEKELTDVLNRLREERRRLIGEHNRIAKEFDRVHQELQELRKRQNRIN
jgi:predicted nuclease with TOPRIM domain